MANNVDREKTARSGIGTFVNGTSNDNEITSSAKTTLETALTQGSYVARVVTGLGEYHIIKWTLNGKPFTTFKRKSGFTNAGALQFLNTMIDISAGTPAPTGVTLNDTTAAITGTGTHQLTATVAPAGANQNVTWTTSNAAVATVSSTGLVTGVAAGTCTITCATASGPNQTATCAVTVS